MGLEELLEKGKSELDQGHFENASRIFEELIAQVDEDSAGEKEKKTLADALRLKAFCDSRLGQDTEAVTGAMRALDIYQAIEDEVGEAEALRRLGYVHWQKSDIPMALEFYNEALKKAEECGVKHVIGPAKIEFGNVYNSMQEYDKAEATFLEAIESLREEKNLPELTRAYNNLGSTYMAMKNYEPAIKALKKSAKIADEIGNMTAKGWAFFNIADCYIATGSADKARDLLAEAVELLKKTDDKIGIAITYIIYGKANAKKEDWSAAEECFNNSLGIMEDLDIPSLQGEVYEEYGKMYKDKGDNELAREKLNLALEVYVVADMEKEVARVKEILDDITT
jgi:tetratricopeptide (TPR) repeat protein